MRSFKDKNGKDWTIDLHTRHGPASQSGQPV